MNLHQIMWNAAKCLFSCLCLIEIKWHVLLVRIEFNFNEKKLEDLNEKSLLFKAQQFLLIRIIWQN